MDTGDINFYTITNLFQPGLHNSGRYDTDAESELAAPGDGYGRPSAGSDVFATTRPESFYEITNLKHRGPTHNGYVYLFGERDLTGEPKVVLRIWHGKTRC